MVVNSISKLFQWLPPLPSIIVVGFVLLFLTFCTVKLVLGIIKLIADLFGKLLF